MLKPTLGGNGVDLVQFFAPVIGHRSGVQSQHFEDDAGMAVADLPHGWPLAGVHIGLDHLAHTGIQSTLDGGFRIGQQPFVIEMGVCIYQHGQSIFTQISPIRVTFPNLSLPFEERVLLLLDSPGLDDM